MRSTLPFGPSRPLEGDAETTVPQVSGGSATLYQIELSLERLDGKPATQTVVLDSDRIRIGSHPANDFVVEDPMVSRFHCTLLRQGGLRISDSDSKNGTRVAGLRVRDADLPLPECRLELGNSVVRIRDVGATSEQQLAPALSLGSLYGISVPMRRLFESIRRVAKSDVDVLIEGENGTGKELIAAEIVRLSPRAGKPLVIVDCGAVSPHLIESELFGHVRGSFTGATRDREGAFEAAQGGTIFLDEVGELPLELQPKLLRVLAARELRRVGENVARRVDVRVIAATNRQLEREVNGGRFREDLYYRLSVLALRVPPLRERPEDVEILLDHFLSERGASDQKHIFSPEHLASMARREWPGNVRELRNYVERMLVLGDATEAARPPPSASDARGAGPGSDRPATDLPFKEAKERVVADFERAYLGELLRWAGGNVSKAARKAKLDRMHLHRLFQRYGLRNTSSLEE